MLAQHKRYWAEIDLDSAENNFNIIKKKLNKKTKLCCVIKADAYGHGAVQMAKFYEEKGADYFAVSNIEEALQLRCNNIKIPIMILGYTPPECAKLLFENDIEQTVFSYEYAKSLNEYANKENVKIKTHLKLDSGMGRLGFSCKHKEDDIKELDKINEVFKLGGIIPFGVFTHFAVSDEGKEGYEYTKKQYENFMYAVSYLDEKFGIKFKIRHISNSAAIFDYEEYQLDMVRAGIVLYGDAPSLKVSCPGIKEVMSLKTVVSMVKKIKKGDSVSYGLTFTADKEMTVATAPVGYADGFFRSNSQRASFIIKGKKVPIIGRVCMDQIIIDVSALDGVKEGDEVIIMGKAGKEEISASEIAKNNDTISYEIICAVGKRVPRYYIKNKKVIEIKDDILVETCP